MLAINKKTADERRYHSSLADSHCSNFMYQHELKRSRNVCIEVRDNTLILTKQKRSVFDLQLKEVASSTLKKVLMFEQNIDKAGKKDMPVRE